MYFQHAWLLINGPENLQILSLKVFRHATDTKAHRHFHTKEFVCSYTHMAECSLQFQNDYLMAVYSVAEESPYLHLTRHVVVYAHCVQHATKNVDACKTTR